MSLENIQRAGGVIPKTSAPPGAVPPNRTTERVEEAMTRGLEMKAFARASGLDSQEERPPSAPAAKQEERTSLDVAALFKAQTDQSNLLLNKITDLTAANSGIAASQEVRDIKATISDIQKRLENPNTANPIETFAANLDSFLSIGEKLASLRAPAEAPPAPNPQAGDIELKKLDLLLQESRQRHELTMEEMRQRWKKEDENHRNDQIIRAAEIQAANNRTAAIGGVLQDLFGAIGGGVFKGQGAGGLAAAGTGHTHQNNAGAAIKRFRCNAEGCGDIIDVPSAEAESITCPSCGTWYALKEGVQPPVPAGRGDGGGFGPV